MNCYNHNELSALGICKHCNKGICQNCLTDTGDGLACKGHCTEEVIAINQMINHNKKLVKGTSGNFKSAGVLYVVMGVIFLSVSLFYFRRIDPLTTSMGVLFLVYGLYSLLKGRAYKENPSDF